MSRDPAELFINGRFLTQDLTGVQRYASEIVKALDGLLLAAGPGAPKCRLLAPKGADAAHLGLNSMEFATGGPLNGQPWEQTWLAAAASASIMLACSRAASSVASTPPTIPGYRPRPRTPARLAAPC